MRGGIIFWLIVALGFSLGTHPLSAPASAGAPRPCRVGRTGCHALPGPAPSARLLRPVPAAVAAYEVQGAGAGLTHQRQEAHLPDVAPFLALIEAGARGAKASKLVACDPAPDLGPADLRLRCLSTLPAPAIPFPLHLLLRARRLSSPVQARPIAIAATLKSRTLISTVAVGSMPSHLFASATMPFSGRGSAIPRRPPEPPVLAIAPVRAGAVGNDLQPVEALDRHRAGGGPGRRAPLELLRVIGPPDGAIVREEILVAHRRQSPQ